MNNCSDVESDGSAGADYGSSTSGTSVDSMSEAFAVEGDIEALDMMHPDDIDLFLNVSANTRVARGTACRAACSRPDVRFSDRGG